MIVHYGILWYLVIMEPCGGFPKLGEPFEWIIGVILGLQKGLFPKLGVPFRSPRKNVLCWRV